ncbi:unnamed protein product [Didymodactylos carnosus]|uniref:ethanolamine kinase n=1 Tax=Didymodactylos carnosus TaxID=1234261 RepID=A0A815E241_9BILA|nr:unnamed protein product [Didymodactylos carnosus]CAF1305443.1 unnamed protein product [Didymodactylos carnosus]CAF4059089.1 unnamed protein product [Didymodactylos carnosus]CAF4137922.1 unnamed protein product [Didymodactylos carnosus]
MSITSSSPPYEDVELNLNLIEEQASRLICVVKPHWATKKLTYTKLTDGVSNALLAMFPTSTDNSDDDIKHGLICKIYGNNSDLVIDREMEICTMVELAKYNFANEILLRFKNGFFYTYEPGKTINHILALDDCISSLIARRLAEFHSITPKLEFHHKRENYCQLPEKLLHYFNLLSGTNSEIYQRLAKASSTSTTTTASALLSSVKQLLGYSSQLTMNKIEERINYKLADIENDIKQIDIIFRNQWSHIQVVYCHNDTQCRNFLYDEKLKKINIIDFEHCMYNYWIFDITNHFLEFAGLSNPDWSLYPDRKFQKKWLKTYLEYAEFLPDYIPITTATQNGVNKSKPSNIELDYLCDLIGKMIAPCHLYWALWAFLESLLNQTSTDFDYLAYGKIRFEQYLAHKEAFFESTLAELPKHTSAT